MANQWHAACSYARPGVVQYVSFALRRGTEPVGRHMDPSSVRMTIEWLVPLGETRPITMALHAVAADTRDVRGCVGCSVLTDIGKTGAVRYVEDWQSEEDLRRRLQSDTFNRVITLIDEASRAPRIEFALPQGTRGLDFVEEVRRAVM